ncbi:nitrophenyl compound nitroreductase subunit ArsF family protein [Mangrovibacterium sp.]|uniref:nitrophenyl compound nitroreductase subunit ArsF family protein n=1 Tax=Mangrovibacterium sp. TaxID=1961364 RepID=UPI0035687567
MMKLVYTLVFVLLVGVISVSAQCCSGTAAENSASTKVACSGTQKSSEVKAYYFHATRRCETCQAVESVAKEAIKEYYGDKVSFESINREEEKNNPLVGKYKISGTALIIVSGDKKSDVTNDAFLNARTNPAKLKSKLKSTIDSML